MKAVGSILVLISALAFFLRERRVTVHRLKLAQSLADDLALLRCGICIHRLTLPQILQANLQESGAAEFWSALLSMLLEAEGTVRFCWEKAAQLLPPPLDGMLTPLGALISEGGDTLDHFIDEVRDEMLSYIKTQREQQSIKLRITAALCFSSAALVILVCV